MSYGLYIAKVVGAAVDGDDRLQIRILPQMHNTFAIPDSKCPRWPFFFREEFFTGTGASDEYVWVVCNDDFSVGYISCVDGYQGIRWFVHKAGWQWNDAGLNQDGLRFRKAPVFYKLHR